MTTDKPTLNAFGMVVSDLPTSLAFYRELGLDIPADADGAPHVDVTLAGGVRLMFDTVETIRSFDPSWQPVTGGHGMGMAFECSSPGMVDEVHARMTSLGHRTYKDPWDADWGQRYASLLDPDGNVVDLYAFQ